MVYEYYLQNNADDTQTPDDENLQKLIYQISDELIQESCEKYFDELYLDDTSIMTRNEFI